VRASDVFVVGGQPNVTYAPRGEQWSGVPLGEAIRGDRSIFVVTGPSKSGKTVLLRHQLPPTSAAVYVPGGRTRSMNDLWDRVNAVLGGWPTESKTQSRADGESETGGWKGSIAPMNIGASTDWSDSSSVTDTYTHARSRELSPAETASEVLLAHKLPLVIDDFHHIPDAARAEIVGGLKDLLFEGVPMVFAAVPHRVADVVRRQPDMNGRVVHIPTGFWTPSELEQIALLGFGPAGLNAPCSETLACRLAKDAAGSPHLMQRLCLQLAFANHVTETLASPRELMEPPDGWSAFYGRIAQGIPDRELAALAPGKPTKGTPRSYWRTKDGDELDVYPLILRALRRLGPVSEVALEDLLAETSALVAVEKGPSRGQITGALGRMTGIARELAVDAAGNRLDPVLEYDAETNPNAPTLHILDPQFAFLLRWRPPEPSPL
jgi:hypothetical protein